MLKEICAALLEADVNIMLVKKLRENVRYKTSVFAFGSRDHSRTRVHSVCPLPDADCTGPLAHHDVDVQCCNHFRPRCFGERSDPSGVIAVITVPV